MVLTSLLVLTDPHRMDRSSRRPDPRSANSLANCTVTELATSGWRTGDEGGWRWFVSVTMHRRGA